MRVDHHTHTIRLITTVLPSTFMKTVTTALMHARTVSTDNAYSPIIIFLFQIFRHRIAYKVTSLQINITEKLSSEFSSIILAFIETNLILWK